MASEDPNNVVALPDGARPLPLRLASCPAGSGADSLRQDRGTSRDPFGTPKALARSSLFAAAMFRSRSGEARARRKRITGEAGRRALPLGGNPVEAEGLPLIVMDISRADVVPTAHGGPEPNNRQAVLNDVLRSELHAALRLMEHRERWWTEGMRNTESAVGMELGRVRNGEMLAAEERNSQMTSLVETLRTTQNRAEQSTTCGPGAAARRRHS